jgi:hypothetical protein
VLNMVNQLVEQSPRYPPVIRNAAAQDMPMSEPVAGGVYWYEQQGKFSRSSTMPTLNS